MLWNVCPHLAKRGEYSGSYNKEMAAPCQTNHRLRSQPPTWPEGSDIVTSSIVQPLHRNVDGYKQTLRSLLTPPLGDLEPACTPNPVHPETGVQLCLFPSPKDSQSHVQQRPPPPVTNRELNTHRCPPGHLHRRGLRGSVLGGKRTGRSSPPENGSQAFTSEWGLPHVSTHSTTAEKAPFPWAGLSANLPRATGRGERHRRGKW